MCALNEWAAALLFNPDSLKELYFTQSKLQVYASGKLKQLRQKKKVSAFVSDLLKVANPLSAGLASCNLCGKIFWKVRVCEGGWEGTVLAARRRFPYTSHFNYQRFFPFMQLYF